jgi:acetyl-CoA carboxylase biotin carboxylase subunit
LSEYFVGGIKTNISLFQRILLNEDFQAAKLDTGFLDRMLRKEKLTDDSAPAEVAAIAAGIFAGLGLAAPNAAPGGRPASDKESAPNWKLAGRREALR